MSKTRKGTVAHYSVLLKFQLALLCLFSDPTVQEGREEAGKGAEEGSQYSKRPGNQALQEAIEGAACVYPRE